MITIECDKCDREFEVDDDLAGQKTECPHCGDTNRVPGASSPSPSPAPAAAGALPSEEGPEETIYDGHPAMFRAHPFRFMLALAVFVGGIVLAIMANNSESWQWSMWVCGGMSIATVIYMLIWWLSTVWFKLTVTNKRTIRQVGIIRRDTSEVLHDHVRNVEIKQSFIQRIFRVGYIGISSAGQDDIEIEVTSMPSPYQIKSLIDRYRNL